MNDNQFDFNAGLAAKEIAQAAKTQGVRDASGLWKRFNEATEKWDGQQLADFVRQAIIEAVVKDSDGGHYMAEIRNNFFDPRGIRWPWGGF